MAISLLLIFGDSKDNRLTVDQIGALYEIVELTEPKSELRFKELQIIDEQHISLILINKAKASRLSRTKVRF